MYTASQTLYLLSRMKKGTLSKDHWPMTLFRADSSYARSGDLQGIKLFEPPIGHLLVEQEMNEAVMTMLCRTLSAGFVTLPLRGLTSV